MSIIQNKQKLKTIGVSVIGALGALATQNAQAIVNIDSSTDYSDNLTVSKMKNIADQQAKDALATARLYDVVKEISKDPSLSQSTKDYINNNLPSGDVLANGATFKLYTGKGSAKAATVDSEPLVRVGAGSTIPLTADKTGVDTENVANTTIGGKNYNFAGATSDGVVSVGDKTTSKYRTVTNVSAGRLNDTSTDAVNGSQLHATNTALDANITQTNANTANIKTNTDKIAKGINFVDDAGVNTNVGLGETFKLSQTNDNVTVKVNAADKAVKIGLANDINLNSVTTGDVSMSTNGINAGGQKVTNVKAGEISAASTDAVNGSQLHETNLNVANNATKIKANADEIAKGWNIQDAQGNVSNVKMGSTLNVKTTNSNLTSTVSEGNVTLGLADDLTVNTVKANEFKAGDVSVSTTGVNAGGQKVTNVKAGDVSATSTDAVNGSQLHETNLNVATNTANIKKNTDEIAKGLLFGDGKTSTRVGMGEQLDITAGSKNVTTTLEKADGAKPARVVVDVNKDQELNSTRYQSVFISGNGLDNGGNKVINVKDGDITETSKDAVNGSQLFQVQQMIKKSSGFNVKADTGEVAKINSGETLNINGGRNIETSTTETGAVQVNLKNDINVQSITVGNTSINQNGINSGGNRITNVAAGINDTDAVNVSQLNGLKHDIHKNRRIASQGIAAAMAMNIEYPEQRPGEIATGVGLATYDGQQALAIGANFLTDSGKYKINATYGQGLGKHSRPAAKISVGWVW
jgi:hypothetical protein